MSVILLGLCCCRFSSQLSSFYPSAFRKFLISLYVYRKVKHFFIYLMFLTENSSELNWNWIQNWTNRIRFLKYPYRMQSPHETLHRLMLSNSNRVDGYFLTNSCDSNQLCICILISNRILYNAPLIITIVCYRTSEIMNWPQLSWWKRMHSSGWFKLH